LPFRIEFSCVSREAVILPRFSGFVVRGLLLNMFRRVDVGVADRLHSGGEPKPYSVSPLRFRASGKTDKGFILAPNTPCSFSVGLLDDSYANFLIMSLAERGEFEVCGGTLTINSISVYHTSYEELISNSHAIDAFILKFLTPTYFSKWGVDFHENFPQPVTVFTNLLKLWNTFSPIAFDKKSFREWVEKSIGVSGYHLRRSLKPIDIGRGRSVGGFTGWCAYKFFPNKEYNDRTNKEYLKLLYTLCKFGEFSNVGGNRTGGFGVIKFTQKKKKQITPIHQKSSKKTQKRKTNQNTNKP